MLQNGRCITAVALGGSVTSNGPYDRCRRPRDRREGKHDKMGNWQPILNTTLICQESAANDEQSEISIKFVIHSGGTWIFPCPLFNAPSYIHMGIHSGCLYIEREVVKRGYGNLQQDPQIPNFGRRIDW